MSENHSVSERRAAIERRVDGVLESTTRHGSTVPKTTMDAFDDRWYGQLVLLSHDSIADASGTGDVCSAAAAIELLRGYCRLRSELLIRFADEPSRPATRNVTPSLLAGDYLYSSAYSTLGEVSSPHLEACFDTLTHVLETIIEVFDARYVESTPSTTGYTAFVDATAGLLGWGAAAVGATLAGAGRSRRDRFATLGRGFSTARQIRHLLDGDDVPAPITPFPSVPDEDELRRHADERREEATRALDSLSSTLDTSTLETFVGWSDDSADGHQPSRTVE